MGFLQAEERIPDFHFLVQSIDEDCNPFPFKFHEGIVSPEGPERRKVGERRENAGERRKKEPEARSQNETSASRDLDPYWLLDPGLWFLAPSF